jgi:cytochrome b
MQVWDIGIRLFHWSIALVFVLNYFLLEPGETAHQIAGYYAFAWLIFRVVWGFLGPQRARFSDFFPTPSRIKTHITQLKQRQLPRDAGHNPLGGVVIFVQWWGRIQLIRPMITGRRD